MKANTLGVAVTQWNHSSLTINLLEALISIPQVQHIVIVDNGSQSKEVDTLRSYLQGIEWAQYSMSVCLIENAINSGFSVGTNLAITKLLDLGCDWLWLLNSDCIPRLVNEEGFKNLINEAEPAIYGASIATAAGSEFSGFYRFNFFTALHSEITDENQFTTIADKGKYPSGANMLVHKSIFEAVGLLNPNTFLYYEELDLMFRARKFGFLQKMSPDFKVFHHEAGSTNTPEGVYAKDYSETWSNLHFYKTHKPMFYPLMLMFRTPLKVLINLLCLRRDKSLAVLSAAWHHLNKKNALIKEAQLKRVLTYG